MDINAVVRRHWFALLLVVLHTLLVGAWAWIELDDAWNDMNPTMLVWVGVYIADYPIHWILHPIIDSAKYTGTYLATLLMLGGMFWFLIGWLVTWIVRRFSVAITSSSPFNSARPLVP